MAKGKTKVSAETAEKIPNEPLPNLEVLQQEMDKLVAENKFLRGKLNEAAKQMEFLSVGEVHKRLEWLWKVISLEGSNDVFGNEFLDYCIKDFKDIMTPQEHAE